MLATRFLRRRTSLPSTFLILIPLSRSAFFFSLFSRDVVHSSREGEFSAL